MGAPGLDQEESSGLPFGCTEQSLIPHSTQGLGSILSHRNQNGTGIPLTASVGHKGTILSGHGNACTQLLGTTAGQFLPSLGCSHARLVAMHGLGVIAVFLAKSRRLQLMQSG